MVTLDFIPGICMVPVPYQLRHNSQYYLFADQRQDTELTTFVFFILNEIALLNFWPLKYMVLVQYLRWEGWCTEHVRT